jgi:hypothetical protein
MGDTVRVTVVSVCPDRGTVCEQEDASPGELAVREIYEARLGGGGRGVAAREQAGWAGAGDIAWALMSDAWGTRGGAQ